ncbi:MAG: peptidylprolyl isomerase [Eubacterium sp.]|nr:peptidylprolyl isomerase [Eubacterium sp.]
MDEKDYENELENIEPEVTESETSLPKSATEYEDNDNWTFDAEAKSLTADFDDLFVADDSDKNASEVVEELEEEEEKHKAEEKEALQKDKIVISKEPLKFIPGVIFVIAVIVVLSFFGYRYYNVPNSKEGALMNPGSVVLTVDDVKVSAGMYNYYYSSIVSYYESYAAYGQVSLDTSQSYDTQYTTDENGNKISWSDYFEKQTLDQIEYITVYYGKALDEGVTLTQKQKDIVEEQLGTLQTSADEAGKTLDEYIQQQFGKYVSTETIRAMLEQYYYAANYRGLYATKPLDEEYLTTYGKEHEKEYYTTDISYIALEIDQTSDETVNASIAQAEEYVSRITDEQSVLDLVPEVYGSFIDQDAQQIMANSDSVTEEEAQQQALQTYLDSTKITVSYTDSMNYFDEDTTNWLFEEAKVGDTNYFANTEAGYIYVMLKTSDAYRDEATVYTIRHALIAPETEESADATATGQQTEFTEEQLAQAQEKAQELLDKFISDNGSETDFALLAEEYSTDPGSTTMSGQNDVYGGLYEITEDTNFVENFKNWVLDPSRKTGDTGLVESDYGYHIMYFIKSAPSYETQLIKDARNAKLNEMIDNADIDVKQGRLDRTVEGYMEFKKANTDTAQSSAQNVNPAQ